VDDDYQSNYHETSMISNYNLSLNQSILEKIKKQNDEFAKKYSKKYKDENINIYC